MNNPVRSRGSFVCAHSTDVFYWLIAYKQWLLSRERKLPTSNGTGKKIPLIFLICALAVFTFPGNTRAQEAANPIDCRNYQSSSVGSTAARGSFVPVSDSAVTINSSIIVYKECVLREMISRQKEAQTAELLRSTLENFGTGREVCNWVDDQYICENRPYYSENIGLEQQELANNTVARVLTGNLLDEISPLYRDDVKRAIQRTYSRQTRNPGASFKCSYAGTAQQLMAIQNGAYNGPQDLFAVADPNCNPMFSFYNAQSAVMSNVAAEQQNMLTQLGWNNGVYSMTETDAATGVNRVITPGFILADRVQQQLGSGFRQLENANDLGQIVDRFFSGIGNAVIDRSIGGLRGLFSASIGTSYIDQVVARTGAAAQNTQVAAALDAVLVAIDNERGYLNAKKGTPTRKGTADVLREKETQLRVAENTCWDRFVLPEVATYSTINNIPLPRRATSTEHFAQTVIDANITPLKNSIDAEIAASDRTLGVINTIAIGVRDRTTDPAGAYNQINELRSVLHTSDQRLAAEQETEAVQTALTTIVTDVITKWGDSMTITTANPEGWCNTRNNKTAVVQYWVTKWR